jgi:CHAT domain-containing protein/Tfp pilus assembly protein PilF
MSNEKSEEFPTDAAAAASLEHQHDAAEKAFAEGIQLYQPGDTRSLLNAVEKLEEALLHWREARDQKGEARALTGLGRVYESLGRKEKAIEQYVQTLPLWRILGDDFRAARTLNQLGQLHDFLDDYPQALNYYRQALPLWRASGIAKGEASTLHNLGIVYNYLGQGEQALEQYQQALALWREMGNQEEQARTLSSMGHVYNKLCAKQRALDSYGSALSLWRAIANQRGEAVTLYVLGKIYNSMGDNQKALHYYRQSLRLWRGVGEGFWEATTLHSVGVSYSHPGKEQKALEYFIRALKLWQRLSVHEKEARTLKEIGCLYNALGEKQKALDYLNRALPLYQASGDLPWKVFTLYLIGSIHDHLGQRHQALESFEKVLALYATRESQMIDASPPESFRHIEEEAAAGIQPWEDEADGLNHYRRMRTRSHVVGKHRENAFLLCYVALVHAALGEKQKALQHFFQALPLWRMIGDLNAEASTRYQIALIEQYCGTLTEAITQIEKGLEIAEFLRTSVASHDIRAFYLASVHDYYELYIEVLMRLDAERPHEGYDARALQISERARGRSLLELLPEALADIRQGVDAQLLERERGLQQLLNSQALIQEQSLQGSSYISESAAAALNRVAALITEYQEVKAQIRATSPRYAALTQPVTLSLREIQQDVLDEDTLLLEYSLGEVQSYLWAVTRASLTSIKLPGRAEIEASARQVYELLTVRNRLTKEEIYSTREGFLKDAADEFQKAADNLSRMLLAPVASLLGNKRLLIVSDGALQYIPFASLPEPVHAHGKNLGGQQPLVVNHEIVYLPSASTLAVLRREQGLRTSAPQVVAVFADPVFDKDDSRVSLGPAQRNKVSKPNYPAAGKSPTLSSSIDYETPPSTGEVEMMNHQYLPRLMFSRQEADFIFAAASGPGTENLKALDYAANRALVTRHDLSRYQIIHFATHALLNLEQPELSGIVLSLVDEQGQPQDGFLRLHEVYNLNLKADVVVLSACQTGLGKEIKGEGLIGLTRGFMYAGAARVIASLWQVDDEATAELMKRFYEAMLKEGHAPVAALRKAQVELSQHKRWQSPFYWAGFVIQGESA